MDGNRLVVYAVERFDGDEFVLQGYAQEIARLDAGKVVSRCKSFPYHNLLGTTNSYIVERGGCHEVWQDKILKMRLRPLE